MTRIISGAAGSIRLDVPGSGTRPTSDRVRESIFAALEAAGDVAGAAVLDLYAGSGALGLEAVSRGSSSADLVEIDGRAAGIADRNARRVRAAVAASSGTAPTVRVHRQSAAAFLARTAGGFDLVFLDPPYALADDEVNAALTALVPALTGGATVVVERSSTAAEPTCMGLLTARERRYGDTRVWWLHPQP